MKASVEGLGLFYCLGSDYILPMLKKLFQWIARILLLLFATFGLFLLWASWAQFDPAEVESLPVHSTKDAPLLQCGKPLKIMSWNIQFLAGKGYTFFFDLPGNKGPDSRPSRESIEQTLADVVRGIEREDPDIVLLQEVDKFASRTGKEDQLKRILEKLPPEYSQSVETYYWSMPFVPHPKVMGSAGLTLAAFSRVRIASARRIALPQPQYAFPMGYFQFRRAILQMEIPVEGAESLRLLNTHLEVSLGDGSVKRREVAMLDSLFAVLEKDQKPWILAGDFNLLPPGEYARIPKSERVWFHPEIDLGPLYAKYEAFPVLDSLQGEHREDFLTHWPNRPGAKGKDKVIDAFFYGNLEFVTGHVGNSISGGRSDHEPLTAQVRLCP